MRDEETQSAAACDEHPDGCPEGSHAEIPAKEPGRSSRPPRRAEEPPTITRGSTGSSRPRASTLRHTQRGRYSVDGPSGTRYTFGSHGTLKVKGEDVEDLLAIKRAQRSCCGPRAPQVLYPLVRA